MPARALYRHCVPGWKSSGTCPSVGMYFARLLDVLRGAIRAPARVPAPPLSSPDVCVIRSRIVMSCSAGTV